MAPSASETGSTRDASSYYRAWAPAASVRFSVIGLNHDHIYAQTDLLLRAAAELVSFFAEETELAARYGKLHFLASEPSFIITREPHDRSGGSAGRRRPRR